MWCLGSACVSPEERWPFPVFTGASARQLQSQTPRGSKASCTLSISVMTKHFLCISLNWDFFMARKRANQGDLLSNMRQPGAGPWAPGVGFCKRSWQGTRQRLHAGYFLCAGSTLQIRKPFSLYFKSWEQRCRRRLYGSRDKNIPTNQSLNESSGLKLLLWVNVLGNVRSHCKWSLCPPVTHVNWMITADELTTPKPRGSWG